jgi:hypothetical protein
LLQGELPFQGIESEKAQELVVSGERPSFYEDVWNSANPIDQTLKKAMIMCHEDDPKVRASARDVEVFLKNALIEMDPNWKVADSIDEKSGQPA